MLDRPIPFNERMRLTFPVVATPDAAIERTLQMLSGGLCGARSSDAAFEAVLPLAPIRTTRETHPCRAGRH